MLIVFLTDLEIQGLLFGIMVMDFLGMIDSSQNVT